MTSKLVVVTGFSLAVGAVVAFLTLGLSTLVATLIGQPLTGLDAMSAMAARGAVVVAILGITGFGVGMLTGSTGAGIGVLAGGLFTSYLVTILALTSRWAQPLARLSPAVNLQAILERGTTYQVTTGPGPATDPESGIGYVERTLSLVHGLGYWAVVLAALLTVTWALFRRRDVT